MIVKNIKFKNNKVEVILDEKTFVISKENYIENPLAIDSNIDDKKIEELLSKEKVIAAKIELIRVLNRKVLTEGEVYLYLKDKELVHKEIHEIINNLKTIGLINDDYACDILISMLMGKRKGRLEIIKTLKEKRICENIIYKNIENIDEETYADNFNKVYEKYLKMYSNKSNKVREQMIKVKLKEYGYEDSYINNLEIENSDNDLDLARKYLAKLLKNKDINTNDYQNVNKIRIKLANRGFNYDIINMVLKEVHNDETY